MNHAPEHVLKHANTEAIFNTFLYLINKIKNIEGKTLQSAVTQITSFAKNLSHKDITRINIVNNAIKRDSFLANSLISNVISNDGGLTACLFIKPDNSASVVFRGTGDGEWLDNGRGLSGISEENTYITYGLNGKEMYKQIAKEDYATDSQVEALNWFNLVASLNNLNDDTFITVSGHSKGGNKAQFITINSDIVDECYSFNSQGFSPEALTMFINQYNLNFYERQKKLYSFSSENDYVNVLGERLTLQDNCFFIKSHSGLHYIESMLDNYGNFLSQCEQGMLSKYIESVSKNIMELNPSVRQYATLGVMNIFQKHLGSEYISEENSISIEKTISGIAIAIGAMLSQLYA